MEETNKRRTWSSRKIKIADLVIEGPISFTDH